jgi:hypothetical protein
VIATPIKEKAVTQVTAFIISGFKTFLKQRPHMTAFLEKLPETGLENLQSLNTFTAMDRTHCSLSPVRSINCIHLPGLAIISR